MRHRHIAVMAGTHNQWVQAYGTFKNYLRAGAYATYYHISSPKDALGMEFDDYRIVGTFWDGARHAIDIYNAVHLRLRVRRGTPTQRKATPMETETEPTPAKCFAGVPPNQKLKTGFMARFTTALMGLEFWLSGVTISRGTAHVETDKNLGEVFETVSKAANGIAKHAAKFNRPQEHDHRKPGEKGWWDIVEVTVVSSTTEKTI